LKDYLISRDFGAHFGMLLENQGEIALWKTSTPLTNEQEKFLNHFNKELFGNVTVSGLYVVFSPSLKQLLNKSQQIKFADITFPIELDEQYEKSFLLLSVRFWYHPHTHKWLPLQMMNVSTFFQQAPVML
jgi:hypothetical protein